MDGTKEFAYHMRRHALRMAYAAGGHASHFGAGMSIIDILAVLYSKHMNLPKPGQEGYEDRDRFILSKGHGVIGYYAALCEAGLIPTEDLDSFENGVSYLFGHPVKNREHGIEFSSGSLGMGLSIGVGLSLAAKKKNSSYRTYVLMGDGECAEGSIWEAAISASHLGLYNLTAIVDRNGLQLGGRTEEIMDTADLGEKFSGFGWHVIRIDGHDHTEIDKAFTEAKNTSGKPTAIIADTKKGYGFSFSEDNNAWHHAVMTEEQYQEALTELEVSYGSN